MKKPAPHWRHLSKRFLLLDPGSKLWRLRCHWNTWKLQATEVLTVSFPRERSSASSDSHDDLHSCRMLRGDWPSGILVSFQWYSCFQRWYYTKSSFGKERVTGIPEFGNCRMGFGWGIYPIHIYISTTSRGPSHKYTWDRPSFDVTCSIFTKCLTKWLIRLYYTECMFALRTLDLLHIDTAFLIT